MRYFNAIAQPEQFVEIPVRRWRQRSVLLTATMCEGEQ